MTVLRTAYVNVLPKTDNFDGELKKRLKRIDTRDAGDGIGSSLGDAMGKGTFRTLSHRLTDDMSQLPSLLKGNAIAAAGVIGTAMAPAIGAALSAGILLAIGGGVLGAGILAASRSPAVQAAFKSFGDRAKVALAGFGKPFEGPLIRAANTFASALERMAPTLKRMGESMAPIIDKLAPAFVSMAEKSLPGIEKAMKASVPLFETLAKFAPQIGTAMSQLFEKIAKTGPGAGMFLKDLFTFLIFVIPKIGDLVAYLINQYMAMRTAFIAIGKAVVVAWKAVADFFTNTVPEAFNTAKAAIGSSLVAIKDFIVGAFRTAMAAVMSVVGGVTEWWNKTVVPAWNRAVAAVSSAVLSLWHKVFDPVFNAIRFIVGNVMAVIQLYMDVFRKFVVGPLSTSITWLNKNIFQPAMEGIRAAIEKAMRFGQAALALFRQYVIGPVSSAIVAVRDLFAKVFAAISSAVSAGMSFIRARVAEAVAFMVGKFNSFRDLVTAGVKVVMGWFSSLGSAVKDKLAGAFSSGVSSISTAWDKLKAAAKKPVDFVINTVINRGIIGTFNKVADMLGSSARMSPIPWGDGPGVVAKRTGFTAVDGPGTGDGPGLLGLLSGPAKWLSGKVGLDKLASFGDNPLTKILTSMGGKLRDMLVDKVKSLIGELFAGGGGSVGAGGLRSGILGVLGALRSMFGNVPLISGLRPGARTLSGALSYHAMGRAIDIAPVRAWAAFLDSAFGSRLKELITPWQEFNRHNGRRHTYTGAVWNQHNFAGGNAHIHAAMDSGGYLMPGWNGPIFNGTGRPEPVTPGPTMDALVGRLNALIAAVERVAPGVGRELNNAAAGMRQLARGR